MTTRVTAVPVVIDRNDLRKDGIAGTLARSVTRRMSREIRPSFLTLSPQAGRGDSDYFATVNAFSVACSSALALTGAPVAFFIH